jgi:hypothetical protein
MKVYLLFAQRVESGGGQHPPVVLSAVDEMSLREAALSEYESEVVHAWEARFKDDLGTFAENYVTTEWVEVTLNQGFQYFRDRLTTPNVAGAVTEKAKPRGDHASYGGITVTRGRQGGQIVDDEIVG